MSNSHLQVVVANIDNQIESLLREVATLQNARAILLDNVASSKNRLESSPKTTTTSKGRGRPKKSVAIASIVSAVAKQAEKKKGRGRPKGTFKVSKPVSAAKPVAVEQKVEKRGRPKGSVKVNKPVVVAKSSAQKVERRGRPKGSFKVNKPIATARPIAVEQKVERRGRPKGSVKVNKPVASGKPVVVEQKVERRGRPKGSVKVNKLVASAKPVAVEQKVERRGRPKGSVKVNKPVVKASISSVAEQGKKGRGRPKGTFKVTAASNAYRNRVAAAEANAAMPAPKAVERRGRPKGSVKSARPAVAAAQGRRGRKPKNSGAKSSDPGPASKENKSPKKLSSLIDTLKKQGKKMDIKQRILGILKLDNHKKSVKELTDNYLNYFGDANSDVKIQRLKISAIIKRLTAKDGIEVEMGLNSSDTFYRLTK